VMTADVVIARSASRDEAISATPAGKQLRLLGGARHRAGQRPDPLARNDTSKTNGGCFRTRQACSKVWPRRYRAWSTWKQSATVSAAADRNNTNDALGEMPMNAVRAVLCC